MSGSPDRLPHVLSETLLSEVRSDEPDLTLRQLALLLVVYQTDEPQTVRRLAAHLNDNKPSITCVLNRLKELGLAHRTIDYRDRRSVLVQRTADGAAMVGRLGMAMAAAADNAEGPHLIVWSVTDPNLGSTFGR